MNDLSTIEKDPLNLFEILSPKHKELLEGIKQLVDMKNEAGRLQHCISHYGERLNQSNRKKLGLKYTYNNPILKHITPLMIDNRVFNTN